MSDLYAEALLKQFEPEQEQFAFAGMIGGLFVFPTSVCTASVDMTNANLFFKVPKEKERNDSICFSFDVKTKRIEVSTVKVFDQITPQTVPLGFIDRLKLTYYQQPAVVLKVSAKQKVFLEAEFSLLPISRKCPL